MDLAFFQVTVACFAVFDFTERRLVFAGITVMVTVFDAAAYRVPAATVMVTSVSYTHLDVYKRQILECEIISSPGISMFSR